VVGAIIDPGNCLDLTESESLDILKAAHTQYTEIMADFEEIEFPKNQPGFDGDMDLVKRKLDCAVINWLHKTREQRKLPLFNTVRGAFFEGGPLFPDSKIERRTHIQWAVQNPSHSVIETHPSLDFFNRLHPNPSAFTFLIPDKRIIPMPFSDPDDFPGPQNR
jgi:hypothetical protein